MNRLLMLFVTLVSVTACNDDYLEVMPENILKIESVHTGVAYEIQVLLPEDYDENQTYQ
jgi:hypothetical protein